MVSGRICLGRICLAHGSLSLVRARRIPMVSSLAAAISDVGLDAADHRLDREHHPGLRHVALARTWASLGGASWLGNAAGIRMCRDDRCNHPVAPNHSIGRATVLNRLAALGLGTQPKCWEQEGRMEDNALVKSSFSATINAPVEKVDIPS